ncbi:MAG: hypothetical protein IBX72_05300 [Nitrospirae bacterium]|nr:hypothetical protein [Nitrospirota bacterium]
MPWVCPLCGFQNDDTFPSCQCGFFADESVRKQSVETSSTDMFLRNEREAEEPYGDIVAHTALPKLKYENMKMKVPDEPAESKQSMSSDEIFVKEIDSWKVTFSEKGKCIYLSTPALQSFKMKLTLDDLQELLDVVYEKSGVNRTTRKRLISGNEISELVEMVKKITDIKKSKIEITFSANELQEIANIINKKLQE